MHSVLHHRAEISFPRICFLHRLSTTVAALIRPLLLAGFKIKALVTSTGLNKSLFIFFLLVTHEKLLHFQNGAAVGDGKVKMSHEMNFPTIMIIINFKQFDYSLKIHHLIHATCFIHCINELWSFLSCRIHKPSKKS